MLRSKTRSASGNQALTQFRRFAEDKGVCPELADRSIIEALVTDGPLEAADAQDVDHVGAGPDRSHNATIEPQKKKRDHQHRLTTERTAGCRNHKTFQELWEQPV